MATAAVLSGPERRRRWTSAEKHRIVEESLAADTTVVGVARRHDIHPNLLHLWRRQSRAATVALVGQRSNAPGSAAQFASVAIAPDTRALAAPPGMIEIELASGTRLRITGSVDAATVSAAIAAAVRVDGRR
ncbi:MAG TPA: transposase [Hyphomicrobiaceae bacterium]|jgi:transposase|nr:transposase [Hyphomicrobiaceae bacterium]